MPSETELLEEIEQLKKQVSDWELKYELGIAEANQQRISESIKRDDMEKKYKASRSECNAHLNYITEQREEINEWKNDFYNISRDSRDDRITVDLLDRLLNKLEKRKKKKGKN